MYPYKPTYKKTAFRVKKPIRSFRDLEVYQSTSQYATEIMTKIIPLLENNSPIKEKLINACLKIPESIATAHSRRFQTQDELKFLDDALENCNKAVVYLEQARDIFIKEIEDRAACDDLIKRYIFIRRKIFNLYKAWKKFENYAQKD
jgi:hypothetical protein